MWASLIEKHLKQFLTNVASKFLIHAYVISRLDFMNRQLYGILQYQISNDNIHKI